ncbi:MAG: hypothetical protein JSW16_01600 [Dehalococcoidales bacterium]|nr:MAG: hypothetical protein JSW16_01600 [Dehalococcoidales bacterium]
MIDIGILAIVVWVGCFVVVAVDSVFCNISPWFWRLAALFGGPFVLLAYGLVREQSKQTKDK